MFHAKERLFYYVFPTIFHLKSIFGLKKVKEIKAHREKLHIINQQLLSASQTKEKKMWKHHKENTEAFFEYFILTEQDFPIA